MIMMRKCRTSFCISQRNTFRGMTQNNVSPIFRYPERVLRMDAERQACLAGNVASTPPWSSPSRTRVLFTGNKAAQIKFSKLWKTRDGHRKADIFAGKRFKQKSHLRLQGGSFTEPPPHPSFSKRRFQNKLRLTNFWGDTLVPTGWLFYRDHPLVCQSAELEINRT